MADDSTWPTARLIPVSGISSQKEAETRAASAVLAVLSVVRDLSIELFAPLGASRAAKALVETFTEPQFMLEGRKVRPDGLVRITYGKATWVALVEVKTGDMLLEADQLNDYWNVAREQGFDAVVTISNEIAASAGVHPTAGLKVRANSKVTVHHISWTALLTAAVMVKVHRGVKDVEQAWIVGELIRYLEHPASGAMAFDDMGPNWVAVRDTARDGVLRRNDEAVREVAHRWDQLLRFACLRLGSAVGSEVRHVLTRAQQEPKNRSTYLVDALCAGRPLDGTLRIPNTVGDVELYADLKARRITAAVNVAAPDDRGGRARCTWMMNQLTDAPRSLVIEAYAKNARTPTVVPLAAALEDRDLLLGPEKREPVRFRLTLTTEMGMSRKTGARAPGFIDSVTNLLESFYGAVVQPITPWYPKAPRISTPATVPAADAEGDAAEGSMQHPSPYRFPAPWGAENGSST